MPADIAESVRRTLLLAPTIANGARVVDGEVERLSLAPAALGAGVRLGADGATDVRGRVLTMGQEVCEGGGGGGEEEVK